MRVGQSSHSAHNWGMSALWHDADYVPEKRFETPVVWKGLEDFALPHEDHQLPDGVADPFQRLEQFFDIAAAQMERGREWNDYARGQTSTASSHGPAAAATTRTANTSDPLGDKGLDPLDDAAWAQHINPKNQSSATLRWDVHLDDVALDKKVQHASEANASRGQAPRASNADPNGQKRMMNDLGDALSAPATLAPLAIAQSAQAVTAGPLPAMASTAVTTTAGVAGIAQLTHAGIAEALSDEPKRIRRGLKTKG